MKIELPAEEDFFYVNSCQFCGIDSYLITPKVEAKWNLNNLHFRSIIIDKEKNVLSCGFLKFFNYEEKINCYPDPTKYKDWCIQEKIDGSCVIVDYVNNQFSMRTRGTSSYTSQNNASDFELLPQKYPLIKNFLKTNSQWSLLFEIVTPNNIIVIRPQDIQFYFLGAINKKQLKMADSSTSLDIWREIGCPLTPEQYYFDNIQDLSSICKHIKKWKGKEGIVLTYNKGQNKIKIKSDWYCFVHRIKSSLNSTKNLIELYTDKQMPSYETFYEIIEKEFDYEVASQLQSEIEKICEVGEKVKKYIDNVTQMIHNIRKIESRKKQAEMIKQNYQSNSSYAFSILDNKPITKEQWIKLINQMYPL